MKRYLALFILFISNYCWAERHMEDRHDGYVSSNDYFIGVVGYFCYCFWAYKSFFKVMDSKATILTVIGSFLTTLYFYNYYLYNYDSGFMGVLIITGPFILKFILSKDKH